MKYENILESIGNTPHLRFRKLFPGAENVWMKLERTNPGGSIKDRIALAMVKDAEERGVLKKGCHHHRTHIGKYGDWTGHGGSSKGLPDHSGHARVHVGGTQEYPEGLWGRDCAHSPGAGNERIHGRGQRNWPGRLGRCLDSFPV